MANLERSIADATTRSHKVRSATMPTGFRHNGAFVDGFRAFLTARGWHEGRSGGFCVRRSTTELPAATAVVVELARPH